MVPAVAVHVAVVPPAATVTDVGTVNAAALLDRIIVAPPVFDSVTVQVELPPDPRLVGTQASELSATGDISVIAAIRVVPLSAAVMVAV